MIVVVARAQSRPETADRMAELLAPLAATSRQDQGCLSYAFYRDVEDATLFVSVETWEDRASLDAHMGAAHTEEALGALADLVAAAPSITAHEVAATERLA